MLLRICENMMLAMIFFAFSSICQSSLPTKFLVKTFKNSIIMQQFYHKL